MKLKQLTALGQLNDALKSATDTGLFDALCEDAHPDVINKFCDLVSLKFVREKAKWIFQPGQKLSLAKNQSVICNGFSGTVVNVHSGQLKGMVDVRLDSGTVTVVMGTAPKVHRGIVDLLQDRSNNRFSWICVFTLPNSMRDIFGLAQEQKP